MNASMRTGMALVVMGLTSAGQTATVGLYLFDDPGGLGTGVNIPDGGQLMDSSGNDLHFTHAMENPNPNELMGFQYTDDVAGKISGAGRTALEVGPFSRVMDSVASDRFSLAQTGELTIEFWHKSKDAQFQNVLGTVNPFPGTGLDANRIQIATGIDSLGGSAQSRPKYAYSAAWIDDAGVGGLQNDPDDGTPIWRVGREKTDQSYEVPDVWKHVAFTASTTTGDTHIYVDGVEVAVWEDGLLGRDFQLFVPQNAAACQGAGKACLRLMGNAIDTNFGGFGFVDELRISDVALLPGNGTGGGELAFNASLAGTSMGPLAGDANKDGQVTGADLISVQQSFGRAGATPLQGDANNDGQVTGADLISVQQNFGNALTASAGPVPEPTALAMLALANLGLRRRR